MAKEFEMVARVAWRGPKLKCAGTSSLQGLSFASVETPQRERRLPTNGIAGAGDGGNNRQYWPSLRR
jgi:hypothetical protein